MARRALDFALAHPLADTGYTAVVNRLKTEVAQADDLGMLQQAGAEREHAAVTRRTTLRQAVRSQHLLRLSKLAFVATKDHPELAGRFVLPPASGPNRTFLLKVRTMLADATEQKELLNTIGLGDTFIEELTQAVTEFEGATESAHAARADHVGAAAELEQLASRCTVDVAVIDTFMRRAFANDAMTLAAWRSAKNVAGPFKAPPPAVPVVPVVPVAPPVATEPVSS